VFHTSRFSSHNSALLPRSLYIHVPFCARRCSYCDFAVEAVREPPVAEWVDAIGRELALVAAEQGWDTPIRLETLYVGGGTPSLLGTGAMERLAERLQRHLSWDPAALEWTCEANPESFTRELAQDWRAAGVNRVSLGVQSFHEPTLRWMGRLHGVEGPARAVGAARDAGFDNLSVDLIFALPPRLQRDWGADLERALALEPEHVSLYGLTAEAGAPLGRWVAEGREFLADEDSYADEYLLAHRRLREAGFRHYEVSNFARGERLSRHNFVYWTGAPYIALGPGAHAYFPPLRRWNRRSWGAYREAVVAGRLPLEGQEVVGAEEAALENAWLQLRTDRGVPLHSARPAQRESAAEWVRFGWARIDQDVLRLTAEGWLLLDRLAVEFAHSTAAV
jgi:oxygen-independent coproporphyrinogen III oxidase